MTKKNFVSYRGYTVEIEELAPTISRLIVTDYRRNNDGMVSEWPLIRGELLHCASSMALPSIEVDRTFYSRYQAAYIWLLDEGIIKKRFRDLLFVQNEEASTYLDSLEDFGPSHLVADTLARTYPGESRSTPPWGTADRLEFVQVGSKDYVVVTNSGLYVGIAGIE